MSDTEDSTRPKQNGTRTKATEQLDEEMADRKARLEVKARKNNIRAEREAMKAAEAEAPPPASFSIVIDTPRNKSTARSKTRAETPPFAQNKSTTRNKSTPAESESLPREKSRDQPRSEFEALTPPRASPKKHSSRPTNQAKNSQARSEAPNPPRASAKDSSSRRLQRMKLVVKISERDGRDDHTEFPFTTLEKIWEEGERALSKKTSGAKEERYKGITALGSTDLDEPVLRSSTSRGTKGKAKPLTLQGPPIVIPRHSTPAGSHRVPLKTYQDSPVPTGIVAHMRVASALSSRSSSPYERSDGGFASDFDGSFVDEIQDSAAFQSPMVSGRKPRRLDYDGVVLEIVDATFKIVCAHLVTEGFFRSYKAIDEMSTIYWKQAAREIGVSPDDPMYRVDSNHRRLIRQRIQSYQGRLKDTIVGTLKDSYKLDEVGKDVKGTIAGLLPHGFHTKPNSPPGKGQYQHDHVTTAINKAFFDVKDKSTPLGVIHMELFSGDDGMPLPVVALACAFSEWGLELYRTGVKVDTRMCAKDVEKCFDKHLHTLQQFETINGELMEVMRKQWYISGRKHSKVLGPTPSKAPQDADNSVPLILPDQPSEKTRRAVAGALKAFTRDSRIKAPPASDESGGFDDFPGSDADVAFDEENQPHVAHKPRPKPRPKPRQPSPDSDVDEDGERHVPHPKTRKTAEDDQLPADKRDVGSCDEGKNQDGDGEDYEKEDGRRGKGRGEARDKGDGRSKGKNRAQGAGNDQETPDDAEDEQEAEDKQEEEKSETRLHAKGKSKQAPERSRISPQSRSTSKPSNSRPSTFGPKSLVSKSVKQPGAPPANVPRDKKLTAKKRQHSNEEEDCEDYREEDEVPTKRAKRGVRT